MARPRTFSPFNAIFKNIFDVIKYPMIEPYILVEHIGIIGKLIPLRFQYGRNNPDRMNTHVRAMYKI